MPMTHDLEEPVATILTEQPTLWDGIYNSIDDNAEGLFGAITARAEAQMLRLSLVYALLDGSPVINVDHVNAALAVWRYCEESAARIFGATSGDPVADRILAAVVEAGDKGLRGTLQHKLFHGRLSGERLELARCQLEDQGLVITFEIPTKGRPRCITYPWSEHRAALLREERDLAKKGKEENDGE